MWCHIDRSRPKESFSGEDLNKVQSLLTELGMKGGVWDKKLTNMYGMCSILSDERLIECALGERFNSWGWCETRHHANRAVLELRIQRASSRGIVKDMREHNFGTCDWLSRPKAQKWLEKYAPLIPPIGHSRTYCSPSINNLPKWKSDPNDFAIGLKWRDIISYNNFIFPPWEK